jgi:hypothetical protein
MSWSPTPFSEDALVRIVESVRPATATEWGQFVATSTR